MSSRRPLATAVVRRAYLRERFSERGLVRRERSRLVGSARADLRRTLTERFLAAHVGPAPGPVLEVGPGTGRFSRRLTGRRRSLVLLDLSRPMLRASRATLRRGRGSAAHRVHYVRGAAELLPFAPGEFGSVVLVGVFGFLAHDGAATLREAARVLRPGGRVVVETQSLTQAIGSLLPGAPAAARRILRTPRTHHLRRILDRGDQPLDPAHLANWEFRYWRPAEIEAAVRAAGFEPIDRLSVGAALGLHETVLRAVRRDRRAWRNLLETEEQVGRWPEIAGGGATFLLAAVRGRRGGR